MLRIMLSILLSMFLLACTVKPVYDYAGAHDFSTYKTFSFIARPEGAVMSIDSARIETEVALQLGEKGMGKTDRASADLLINYRLERVTRLEPYGSSFAVGMGIFKGHGRMGLRTPPRYRERNYSKLVLEFLNPSSKSVIWQSVSQKDLTATMSGTKRTSFIRKEIDLMLLNYPPQAQ